MHYESSTKEQSLILLIAFSLVIAHGASHREKPAKFSRAAAASKPHITETGTCY